MREVRKLANARTFSLTSVRRYFASKPGEESIIIGVSVGNTGGFSFNIQPDIRPIYRDTVSYLRSLEQDKYNFFDSEGNQLYLDEILMFADFCASINRPGAFSKIRDRRGYWFTNVRAGVRPTKDK